MKKMQRACSKILKVLIVLIITTFNFSFAQTSAFRLKTADSLYHAGRYTQSLDHYQEILKQKQFSPAMLLKMAYIEEALNNVGQAMYYLNLYFLATNDKSVLEKMEELAEKYDLQGYQTTDADRVLTFYHDYYQQITFALAALMIFMLSLIFYVKRKSHGQPYASGVILLVFAAAFFVHLNYGERVTTAIITSSHTYIMDGPSPGASLLQIVGDGHRVEVIGKKDVWLKIRWDGNVAFVKENNLLPIRL